MHIYLAKACDITLILDIIPLKNTLITVSYAARVFEFPPSRSSWLPCVLITPTHTYSFIILLEKAKLFQQTGLTFITGFIISTLARLGLLF